MIYLPENNRCGKEHTAKNTTDISPPWHHLWAKINYVTSRDLAIEMRKIGKYTWQEQKSSLLIVCAGFRPPFWVMWLESSASDEGSESSRRDRERPVNTKRWPKGYFGLLTSVFPVWITFVYLRSRSRNITRKPSCLWRDLRSKLTRRIR